MNGILVKELDLKEFRGIRKLAKFKIKEIWKMLVDLMAITYRHRIRKQYQSLKDVRR